MSLEEAQAGRVIAHIDLDAFYAAVEVHRAPKLRNQPLGVVQYNPLGDLQSFGPDDPHRHMNSSNGSLIAVSYEARKYGVKRNMRGNEARQLCAQAGMELQLVQVPTSHGKADLTLYRQMSKQVMDVLSRLSICERASIDECYLDISAEAARRLAAASGHPQPPVNADRIHVAGQVQAEGGASAWWARPTEAWGCGERLLAAGAAAVADLRAAVHSELGFTTSAGIAHNKILAKLVSGLHKPAQQTVVPLAAVPALLFPLPVGRLRQLGGKFGDQLTRDLGIATVGELASVPLARLEAAVGEADAQWLSQLARGIDLEEVKERRLPQSISCGKTFRGPTQLRTLAGVNKWLVELGKELEERLAADRAANERTPQLLTLGLNHSGAAAGVSRSCALRKPTAAVIAADALALVKRWVADRPGWAITGMSLASSNFTAAPTGASTITRFLQPRVGTRGAPASPPPPMQPPGAAPGRGALAGRLSAALPYNEQDLDPEALAALPPDIQRELRLAFMASRGGPLRGGPAVTAGSAGGRLGAGRAPAKRARAAAPGAMERFLTRRTG
ncbi:hypothetical protein WJX81_005483 [Elliptochloris bilobata]|uniref:DNA polymerase eta n=1 Tax=Elliptochloris bilobata TaxID=381761 RepID=A0AAW1QZH1_9CHLO